MKLLKQLAWVVGMAIMIGGCAGERAHREGLHQIAEGRFDEGLANLKKASEEAPDNVLFRADFLRRQEERIYRLLAMADARRTAGAFDISEGYYRQVLRMEAANNRALTGLEALEGARRYAPIMVLAEEALSKGEGERAAALLKPLLVDGSMDAALTGLMRRIDAWRHQQMVVESRLHIGKKKPISLDFRDADLRVVFEVLARSSGVNFIFDPDVRSDLRTTVFLRDASPENAVDLLLQTSHLEKKVLNSDTILIYPNTPEKLKHYQELIVRGFYLANADVKQTQMMMKGLLKTKDIFIDEKLNLIVMRDTPDAIKLAEKLIAMHDLSEPEVMLEVEVLEVKRTRLLELGMQWPNKLSLSSLGVAGADAAGVERIGTTLSGSTINLHREVGDANILANPRIRARNREKAKIMIGDKVPVSTATTTATGVTSESVQYLDVGIKLEVEPNVYLQDEVAIKVDLEVSSITNQITKKSGSVTYQIGTRSAITVLRLRDGETQILAGLIGDEDRMSANRVPGLGDIPILGRLFSSQKDDRQKTEIVLSITPRLIRNIRRSEVASSEFWSGTASSLRNRPLAWQTAMAHETSPLGEVIKDDVKGGEVSQRGDVAPSVALSWQAPEQVKLGTQFKVALNAKTGNGLRSLPLQLDFDPAVLQVVDIAEGVFFKRDGGQSSFSSHVDAKSGKAFVRVVRAGVDGMQGDAAVAVVTFRTLDAARTEINVVAAMPVSVDDVGVASVLPGPCVIEIEN